MVELSIIIVTWNVRNIIEDCLRSLIDSLNTLPSISYEVIVVDNASSDNTPAFIKENFPSVDLIDLNENTGFSRGNNIGISASKGEYIYFINPDTISLDTATTTLLDYLRKHSDVGVVGPKLLNEDGSIQSSRRRFPTKLSAIFESTWLENKAPKMIIDQYHMRDLPDNMAQEVDWLTGAAFMTRRRILTEIGGFDEIFFMYSEELDWQLRVKKAGWKIVYVPDAEVIHLGGKSSEQVIALQHIYFQTSKIKFFAKHYGNTFSKALRFYLLLSYIIQFALEWLKKLAGHKPELRAERLRAYKKVIKSGLKDPLQCA